MGNSLHMMVDYGTLLKGRRDLLITEQALLKIKNHLGKYRKFRNIELLERKTIRKLIKELKDLTKDFELNLPHVPHPKEEQEKEKKVIKTHTLEQELADIRAKLAKLH